MTDLAGKATEYRLLNRQIETLYRVSSFVGSIYDLEELLSLVMDEAERAVDAEASSVALYGGQACWRQSSAILPTSGDRLHSRRAIVHVRRGVSKW